MTKIKSAKAAGANSVPSPSPTKRNLLIALLSRDEGTTLDEIITATNWLPHTSRAALTGLKKKGHAVRSDKVDGVRTYRIMAQEVA
jgi:hypothetical protein